MPMQCRHGIHYYCWGSECKYAEKQDGSGICTLNSKGMNVTIDD